MGVVSSTGQSRRQRTGSPGTGDQGWSKVRSRSQPQGIMPSGYLRTVHTPCGDDRPDISPQVPAALHNANDKTNPVSPHLSTGACLLTRSTPACLTSPTRKPVLFREGTFDPGSTLNTLPTPLLIACTPRLLPRRRQRVAIHFQHTPVHRRWREGETLRRTHPLHLYRSQTASDRVATRQGAGG